MEADEFKAWRKRMGWKQSDVALALGLTTRQVGRLERGEFSISRAIEISCNCLENHPDEI